MWKKGGQSQDYVKLQEEDLFQTHPKRPDFSNTTIRFASEHPTNTRLESEAKKTSARSTKMDF